MKKLHTAEEIKEFKKKGWGCSHKYIGKDEILHLLSGGSLYNYDGEYGTIITPALNRTNLKTYNHSGLEYSTIEEAEKDIKKLMELNNSLKEENNSLKEENDKLALDISELKQQKIISYSEVEALFEVARLKFLCSEWDEEDYNNEVKRLLEISIDTLKIIEKGDRK